MSQATWTDFRGVVRPVIESKRRLKFKIPLHAALRAHVHHRDGYRCLRCGAHALVPTDYDGRYALETTRRVGSFPVLLVLDHVVTLKAGGMNVAENLQTLCETCNGMKIPEDVAAARAFRGGAA